MIIKTPGKISIMVGGNVVGVAESAKITVAEDEGSTKEWSDPWRTPYPTKSWDVTGKAIFQKPSDVLRGLLGDTLPGDSPLADTSPVINEETNRSK